MQTLTQRPKWLNKKVDLKDCYGLQDMFNDLRLHTVCKEAGCPNISECFSKGTAAFMILGSICTRNCKFCGIEKGLPVGRQDLPAQIDQNEPERVAEAIKRLNLKHAVITSVTRDDLDDGGAEFFKDTILAIRKKAGHITIEVLIPDFKGDERSVRKIVEAEPDIINHNIEIVPRLYMEVRPHADYQRSLNILRTSKRLNNKLYTKSGLMAGLGENDKEVLNALSDLKDAGCDFVSIGQYLSPSRLHYPVKEYVTPEKFAYYKEGALRMGFLYAASGPYVRSSYLAAEYIGDASKGRCEACP